LSQKNNNRARLSRPIIIDKIGVFGHFGGTMDRLANSAAGSRDALKLPAIVIIERRVLARTSILSILARAFPEFEIVDVATTLDLNLASEKDICLVALDIENNPISDPCVESDLAAIVRAFPKVPVALLSNRDDEGTALAAIRRGVRGFFSTSIPLEVAIAGLRLVLAGGVYRPLPIDTRTNEGAGLEAILKTCEAPMTRPTGGELNDFERIADRRSVIDLTPRERQVLAVLELGLPNKLIAAKLNLSENTVKMHIQHIMRKMSARNRTEVVLLCRGRLSRNNEPTLAYEFVSS
jgi:DNA-binding NarL/FixJ family response regulator